MEYEPCTVTHLLYVAWVCASRVMVATEYGRYTSGLITAPDEREKGHSGR